jgi:hypothetical protein
MIREKLIQPSQECPLLYSQYRYQTVLHSKNLGYFHLTV